MDINVRRDGLVLVLLAVMLVMLVAALSGAYRLFGYGFVGLVALLLGAGFVSDSHRPTWWPPVVATAVLFGAFTGLFAMETAVVRTAADTWLGFQPGTSFLIYGVWIPSFFTIGVAFALVFERLQGDDRARADRKRAAR